MGNLHAIGMKYGGPIIYSYVIWILKRCIRLDVNRLYFVARDGMVLKLIADKIIEEEQLEIKTKYIYGSRVAWRTIVSKKDILASAEYFDRNSVYKVMDLIHIFGEQFVKKLGIETTVSISGNMIYTLLYEISNYNDDLLKPVFEFNQYKQKTIKNYLVQELDLSDSNFAFVDMQGSGRTLDHLCGLLNTEYGGVVKSFYFYCSNSSYASGLKCYSMLQSPTMVQGMIEMLTRAPHGQTVSLKNVSGVWIPELDDVVEISEVDFYEYMNGIHDYIGSSDITFKSFDMKTNAIIVDDLNRKISQETNCEIRTFFDKIYKFTYSFQGESSKSDSMLTAYTKIKDRIIIYGAGKNGKYLYNQLLNEKEIICIVDSRYTSYVNDSLEVKNPDLIGQLDFNQILITVSNISSVIEITRYLNSLGVNKSDILWMIPNEKRF